MASDDAADVELWTDEDSESWASVTDRVDAELEVLGRLALDALAPDVGATVLDVGCGAGASTIELARRVGPSGGVVGVDVSRLLLTLARRRLAVLGLPNVTFVQADAQSYAWPGAAFSAVYSRFGVMFFADPVRAFANLRGSTASDGRLGFVCWQSVAHQELLMTTRAALEAVAGAELSALPADGAPGPFAFADPGRIRSVLASGGWSQVEVRPQVDELVLDDRALAERITFITEHGSVAPALAGSEAVRAEAVERLRDALSAHDRDGAARFTRAVWVVTAVAGRP